MTDINKQGHARSESIKAAAASKSGTRRWAVFKLLSAPPVYLRWMLLSAGIAALIMGVGSLVIYQQYVSAQVRLSLDYGGSLAQFIAVENADAVLLEDWVGLQTIVESINREQAIGYLNITDHQGVIRGSTNASQVGQSYPSPENAKLLNERGAIRVYEVDLPNGAFLHFEVPILFQRAEIGRVHLGLVRASQQKAISATLFMLGLIVLISMAGLTYAASTRLAKPLKILERALQEMAWGRYECRITERGPSDVKSIYNTYNQIAEFLQQSEITLSPASDDAATSVNTTPPDNETKQVDIASLRRRSSKIPSNPFADGLK
jgi:HAMP domain-containing protein